MRGVFLYALPFSGPKERSRQALDREIWVAKGFSEIILSLKKLSISRTLAFEV